MGGWRECRKRPKVWDVVVLLQYDVSDLRLSRGKQLVLLSEQRSHCGNIANALVYANVKTGFRNWCVHFV